VSCLRGLRMRRPVRPHHPATAFGKLATLLLRFFN